MRHLPYAHLLIVLSYLTAMIASSALAQDATPVPAVQNWSINLGHWVNEEQRRSGPNEPWQKLSSEWNNSIMPGGFFVRTPGKVTKEDGSVVSWGQVWGHDPVTKSNFSHWFASNGYQGKQTFSWNGRTLESEGVVIAPDGEESKTRSKQKIAANSKTMEITTETLTDGKWWVSRKVKGKRVD